MGGLSRAPIPTSGRKRNTNEVRKESMKRLSPERRSQLISDHIRHLASDWTCRYGRWNSDKLLAELESALRARRREKTTAEKAARRIA
jgi:hypothetical protein